VLVTGTPLQTSIAVHATRAHGAHRVSRDRIDRYTAGLLPGRRRHRLALGVEAPVGPDGRGQARRGDHVARAAPRTSDEVPAHVHLGDAGPTWFVVVLQVRVHPARVESPQETGQRR
jgi:hypothetical protein